VNGVLDAVRKALPISLAVPETDSPKTAEQITTPAKHDRLSKKNRKN
jgi:hypothetical protein